MDWLTGAASDAHLYEWQLDYYQPTTRPWQPLVTGHSSVTNGLLWSWNTTGLPRCYYTVRQRVWDNSIANLCSDPERQYAEDYVTIAVGEDCCPGDLNCDGTFGQGSFGDINPFVLYLSNFSARQAAHAGCDPRNGDINGDGTYGQGSFGDINPFVALLSGGG